MNNQVLVHLMYRLNRKKFYTSIFAEMNIGRELGGLSGLEVDVKFGLNAAHQLDYPVDNRLLVGCRLLLDPRLLLLLTLRLPLLHVAARTFHLFRIVVD